ncbi:AMP-binding protein [Alcaligenaceae bacterium CGII-47]|nr:AMP-binding protein [Alcaligenaceae bacterium CGII-47]
MNVKPDMSHQYLYCRHLAQLAQRTPEQIFLREGARTLSFAQAHAQVQRLAHRLHQYGVQPGTRAILWMENGLDYALIWLALSRIGAVSVPLNQAYHGPILAHQINDVNAEVLITDSAHWPRIAELADQIPAFSMIFQSGGDRSGEVAPGAIRLEDESGPSALEGSGSAQADTDLPYPHASECMSIFYTSGTTGPSKGVLYTHMQAWCTAQSVSPYLTCDDVFYMTNPMCHVGLPHCLGATLLAGASLVVRPRFSARAFWSEVRQYGVTSTMMLGSVATFLNAAPPLADDREHSLRKVLMVPVLKDSKAFCQRFGVAVMSWFNMTELSVPLDTGGFSVEPDGSCGRVREGVSAKIVDEYDQEVARGTPGELLVRDEQPWTISPGYFNQSDATVSAWRNLWFHTGDLCIQDESGAFFFVDRLKDCIRRRGENISSHEVESQIQLHPAVVEAAVIGVSAQEGEQEVQAIVVVQPGMSLSLSELLDFLQPRLPHFCLPRYVDFSASPLPRTETGKIRKNILRTQYPEGRGDREAINYIVRR